MRRNWKFCATALAAWCVFMGPARPLAGESPDTSSPALTRDQKEEFLRTAEILKRKSAGTGRTWLATLSEGRVTHEALIRTVDAFRYLGVNIRDSYKYNVAAYRLDKLLGLGIVPCTVERRVGGEMASVTWWEGGAVPAETDRFDSRLSGPAAADWHDQVDQAKIFQQLVFNSGAGPEDVRVSKDRKVRLVGFTRAFAACRSLREPNGLARIDRRIYEGLRRLNEETVVSELGSLLTKSEIRGLLARRNRIVKFFNREIERHGVAAVVCDRPGH